MKIIHSADWHIGKLVNEYSMIEDQRYILKQLFQLIESEQPDAFIISGDIYDRSIPPKEAVELLDEVLTKLINEYQVPTFIITGNHDSSERLSFTNKLLEDKKLYIQGSIDEIKKILLEDQFGIVNFYLVPYQHPMYVRHIYALDGITDHNESMKAILNKIDFNKAERNILITHHYIASLGEELDQSDSERRLSVGGAEFVDVELVKDFDYVALGHLHKPQKVKYEHIRYPGSLLKYSFSEVDYKKGVNVIELNEKGNHTIRFEPLKPKRDLKKIKGSLNELTSKKFYSKLNCEDYICAVLTDETELYDPISNLRAVYPNLMQIERNHKFHVETVTKARGNFKEKDKLTLFEEFYEKITNGDMDELKQDVIKNVIDEVMKEGV